MQDRVYFGNDEPFDADAMLTFGVSAKGSNDAIGYFGTGFKYAVAIILRSGGGIQVDTADDCYLFGLEKKTIRGKEIEIVTVNGENAGFTAHLGANWSIENAYRELWANCMDEGGRVGTKFFEAPTLITVKGAAFVQAHNNRDGFILTSKPIIENHMLAIHEGSRPRIFYRDFAVAEMNKAPIFTYNVQSNISLTEDRTARYGWEPLHSIARGIQLLEDRDVLRTILSVKLGDQFEAIIPYDADWMTSQEFIEVARELHEAGHHVSENCRQLLAKVVEKAGDWPEWTPTKVQLQMLGKARDVLKRIGIDTYRYPVKLVSGLGSGVMGRAMKGTIYLSDIPFNQGTKMVASTLLEEWVHNEHGVEDFDRAMQNWLFDKVLTLAEELQGAPL